ncbi:hypothetical protein Patl1_14838 [Pistacia atlantica]|uniref:Uncharacterized protein n=1 Tax=Pistacia atlantica TaxID=434234 RepID=A0ACC1AY07_9ROSI|nr:hypothetical protein Patl1_14838 [Pistacia atlantica]
MSPSSSLKHKLKSSLTLSCLYKPGFDHQPETLTLSANTTSRLQHGMDVKDKCHHFVSRMGGGPRQRCTRKQSPFRYDASSYALNFDDKHLDEPPLTSFVSRLPESPTRKR